MCFLAFFLFFLSFFWGGFGKGVGSVRIGWLLLLFEGEGERFWFCLKR